MSIQAASRKKPRLLLPAGTADALDAAINAGADEVYFGGVAFNARMNAGNFSDGEIGDAITKCHFYGVRANITLNTLVLDREYADMLRFVELVYRADCDSIICADLGAAEEIRRAFPDLRLHASTQCAAHNSAAARVLSVCGFSRVVLARECSFGDIVMIKKDFPDIEYEMFVHGSLCVSHSGMCGLSACMGGRSANRGECAQPCRLPCGDTSYPLSLKDLCLARYIPEIIASGVDCLKVEGRMKSPEYVYGVGKIYRALLDEGREATDEEMTRLRKLFSRSGFTDGYFSGSVGRSMLGVRRDEDKDITRQTEATAAFEMKNDRRRLHIKMTAEFLRGRACRLQLSCGDKTSIVYGMTPEEAKTAPLTADAIEKNLLKLGNTPFIAYHDDISIIADEGIMVPVAAINSLRRTAVNKLLCEIPTVFHPERKQYTPPPPRPEPQTDAHTKPAGASIAHFTHSRLIPPRVYLGAFSYVYLPIEEYLSADAEVRGLVNGVELPAVVMQSELDRLDEMAVRVKLAGINNVMCSNLGSLAVALKYDFIIHGGPLLNVYSSKTADRYKKLGFEDVIPSQELRLAQIKALCAGSGIKTGTIVYGKLPVMMLEKCVIRDIAMGEGSPCIDKCAYCDGNPYTYITDRRGCRLPVRRAFAHRNIVYNSIPLYMADRMAAVADCSPGGKHYFFTDETPSEAVRVIDEYRNGTGPLGEVRRL